MTLKGKVYFLIIGINDYALQNHVGIMFIGSMYDLKTTCVTSIVIAVKAMLTF